MQDDVETMDYAIDLAIQRTQDAQRSAETEIAEDGKPDVRTTARVVRRADDIQVLVDADVTDEAVDRPVE